MSSIHILIELLHCLAHYIQYITTVLQFLQNGLHILDHVIPAEKMVILQIPLVPNFSECNSQSFDFVSNKTDWWLILGYTI